MTDDEAFIRVIVDSPGDDTPRLVYADWLDDRDDPRGPYMRAERETVVTGDIARLRELAVGLDPVWVARVSLPPIGVCLTHSEQLSERGPSVSATEVLEAECRIGVSFPADYKAFLLNYNGGYFDASRYFDTPDGPRANGEGGWHLDSIERIHRFMLRSGDALPDDIPARWGIPPRTELVEDWVSRFVVIGHNPDYIGGIFLGVSGADRGHVRILDTSVELEAGVRHCAVHPPFAATFAEFVELLPGAFSPLTRTWPTASSEETDTPF